MSTYLVDTNILARLVVRADPIMIESGIEQILTFNADDFRRFPGVTPVSPSSLTAPWSKA